MLRAVCAQNLDGLAASDHCPQCNQVVATSIYAANCKEYPRPWLARIHFGLRLIVAVTFLALGEAALSLTEELGVKELHPLGVFWWHHKPIEGIIALLAGSLGLWLITTPLPLAASDTPTSATPTGELSARQFLRCLVALSTVGTLMYRMYPDDSSVIGVMKIFFLAACIPTIDFLFFRFVQRDLAIRTGQDHLVRQAALLKWIRPSANVLFAGVPFFVTLFTLYLHRYSDLTILYIIIAVLRIAVSTWVINFLLKLIKPFNLALHAEPTPAA